MPAEDRACRNGGGRHGPPSAPRERGQGGGCVRVWRGQGRRLPRPPVQTTGCTPRRTGRHPGAGDAPDCRSRADGERFRRNCPARALRGARIRAPPPRRDGARAPRMQQYDGERSASWMGGNIPPESGRCKAGRPTLYLPGRMCRFPTASTINPRRGRPVPSRRGREAARHHHPYLPEASPCCTSLSGRRRCSSSSSHCFAPPASRSPWRNSRA